MKFIDVADRIIRGYSLLSAEQRETFESSSFSKKFVDDYLSSFNTLVVAVADVDKKNSGWGSWVNPKSWYNYLSGNDSSQKSQAEKNFDSDTSGIIENLKQAESFKKLLIELNKNILGRIYPLECFSEDELKRFLESKHAHSFRENILSQIKPKSNQTFAEAFDKKFGELVSAKDALTSFEEQISTDLVDLTAPLKVANLTAHLYTLNELLPLVKNTDIFNKIRDKYNSGLTLDDCASIDKQALEDYFFDCLNANNSVLFNFLDFNHEQAKYLSEFVYNAFLENKKINFKAWLKDYEYDLNLFIQKQLAYPKRSLSYETHKGNMYNSLTYLWNKKGVIVDVKNLIKDVSDAKSFMHYFGVSSQNDNLAYSVLDLCNVLRYRKQAVEAKGIFKRLLQPFTPLYTEYRNISIFKSNSISKFLRGLMPIFIVVGVIVLTGFMLSPLGLPELAFLAAMIPAVIIGLTLATAYVSIKNKLYKVIREAYYGTWSTPEFRVTPKLKDVFGDSAERIRSFYIKELDAGEKLKTSYNKKNVLTKKETEDRDANLTNLQSLYIEWLDISANHKCVDKETIEEIVYIRLTKTHNSQYQSIISALGKPIQETTKEMVKEAEERISKYNSKENIKPYQSFPQQTFFGTVPDGLVKNIKATANLISVVSPPEADDSAVAEFN